MQMERRMNGDSYSPLDDYYNIGIDSSPSRLFTASSPPPPPPPSSSSPVTVGAGGHSHFEHHVSKFDTLAGVAIKYGVEVADIKRINGLVTDHQMFALMTLKIPLPGRHPPSPILSNGVDTQGASSSERTPVTRRHSDMFDSFESLKLKPPSKKKVSPAMSSLQGYYGLKSTDSKIKSEGLEMSMYQNGTPPLTHTRKTKSIANGLMFENGDLSYLEDNNNNNNNDEKLTRRRQNSDNDLKSRTPEMVLKEDCNNNGGIFSAFSVKGLALRPKSGNNNNNRNEGETSWLNAVRTSIGDSFNGVRKSSSTSSLQDSEISSTLSSIWSTSKWSLKPDRPIFDGLPKPISGIKKKAALD